MPKTVILAIDQGTTGTTVLAIDSELRVLGKANCEFRQVFPQPGWVEHEGENIWQSVEMATKKCLEQNGISPNLIAAIGITNQRETTCLFKRDSSTIHNFIVWQCRRTTDLCNRLKNEGTEQIFVDKTGLVLDPYFSGTKLRWLFDNVVDAAQMAKDGETLFGTVDTWLVHKLTGCSAFVTDVTNASRTLMMNLKTCDWDDELLSILNIPKACLPQIRTSSEVYGHTKSLSFLPDGIPVAGIAGDQQAALFGQTCFEPGEAKATFGTGCFLLLNTGDKIVRSVNGLLTSVAIQIGNEVQYCLEGSSFIAGAAVQWLKEGLEFIKDVSEIEKLAEEVDDSGEVVFVPALVGLGAPYWRPEARGILTGITRDTNKSHIARAVLEGITLINRDIVEAMKRDAIEIKTIKVDGGAAKNNLLMQMQADYCSISCIRPKIIETTALGAAALAGLAVGVFPDKQAFRDAWQPERTFSPHINEDLRQRKLSAWRHAVERA